ncbi:hypothetical protein [Rhodococcus sp. B10]|uniref:hypothetical protein n=1 Tax=Rhodococcus sp. B10 TaxID=2695876 RepID=UPI001431D0B1|nr:hypothetical protein [Rhodococcus sp. B10]NIL77634.1 hypothetical protein [Rhodococcus sp. B10]
MILVTIRGTANQRGALNGAMTGHVARHFQNKWDLYDISYSASIGNIRAAGELPLSLDDSVTQAVADLVRFVQSTNDVVGLVSYSLGGIAAMRFLEGVASGKYRNRDGSRMEIAFHVGIANPSRNRGDSAVSGLKGSGLHSSHGPLPAGMLNLEVCNPHDIIGNADEYSPARHIARGLSPFAALEGKAADPFKSVDALRKADWLARIRPGRYTEALIGLAGYAFPNPARTPRTTEHTLYATERFPGSTLTWTDWAAAEIDRRF